MDEASKCLGKAEKLLIAVSITTAVVAVWGVSDGNNAGNANNGNNLANGTTTAAAPIQGYCVCHRVKPQAQEARAHGPSRR